MAEDSSVCKVTGLSSSMKRFLGLSIKETHNFTVSSTIYQYVRDFKKDHNLEPQTIVLYLHKLNRFLDWIDVHHRETFPKFAETAWTKIVKNMVKKWKGSAAKNSRIVSKAKHARVPPFSAVMKLERDMMKLLLKDVNEKTSRRSYRDLQVMNFLVMAIRLNIRAGPLLNITWTDIEKIKKEGFVRSSKHKTGYKYDLTISVQDDQLPCLDRIRQKFTEVYRFESQFVLSSTADDEEHSMCRYIKNFLISEFGEEFCYYYDYNSTSLRKSFENYINSNKRNLSSSGLAAHFEQSGHTEATAQSNYIAPQPSMAVLDFYRTLLDNCGSEPSFPPSVSVSETQSICGSLSSVPSSSTPKRKAPLGTASIQNDVRTFLRTIVKLLHVFLTF